MAVVPLRTGPTTPAEQPTLRASPIESGRRWALMKESEYFVTERLGGETWWCADLKNAELYPTPGAANHDLRVMAKRFPKTALRIVEI